jgi:hypothetical protein
MFVLSQTPQLFFISFFVFLNKNYLEKLKTNIEITILLLSNNRKFSTAATSTSYPVRKTGTYLTGHLASVAGYKAEDIPASEPCTLSCSWLGLLVQRTIVGVM